MSVISKLVKTGSENLKIPTACCLVKSRYITRILADVASAQAKLGKYNHASLAILRSAVIDMKLGEYEYKYDDVIEWT